MTGQLTQPTPYEWIAEEARDQAAEGQYLHRVVAVGPEGDGMVALVPNFADAALMSASKNMLETLTWIHEQLNFSKRPISLDEFNLRYSECCAKIANEIGEM